MSSKIVHRNLMHYILQSLDIDPKHTFEYDYKAKLQQLMQQYNIKFFEYRNIRLSDNLPISEAIYGELKEDTLEASFDGKSFPPRSSNTTQDLPSPRHRKRYLWIKFEDKTTLLYTKLKFAKFTLDNTPNLTAVSNEDYHQIYKELTELGYRLNPNKEEVDSKQKATFHQIANAIVSQLDNDFYQTVKMRVDFTMLKADGTIQDGFSDTNSASLEDYEVRIQITMDAYGNITAKSNIQDDYLQDGVDDIAEIAYLQGIEVDVEHLRQQVHHTLNEAANTNQGIGQQVLQFLQSKIDKRIGGYIEAVQATHKVAKNVWEEGAINTSLWHSTGEHATDYHRWPAYMNQHPIVGGLEDGVVDQVVGIPMALKSVYEIATEPQKREQILSLMSKEGITQIYDGMVEEATQIMNDGQRVQHVGGKTVITIATVWFPFAATKGALNTTGVLGPVQQIHRKTKAVFKGVNSQVIAMLQRVRRWQIDNYIKKRNLYKKQLKKNPNNPTLTPPLPPKRDYLVMTNQFLDTIQPPSILNRLAFAPNFEQVLMDMAISWNKFKGGKYVLQYAAEKAKEGKVLKFEILDDDVRRFYDIQYEEIVADRTITFNLELKNWTGFFPISIKNQFIKDLNGLKDNTTLQWVFNKVEGGASETIEQLQKNVLKALTDKNGVPLRGLDEAARKNGSLLKELFDTKDDIEFDIDVIEQLKDIEKFKKVFQIVEV